MPAFEKPYRWEPFAPEICDNRELEPQEQFVVELAVGLSKTQLTELAAAFDQVLASAERVKGMVDLFTPFIRLGSEPLTVDGKAITNLPEYFEWCAGLHNAANLLELPNALAKANSVQGMHETFFARLSGGFGSTAAHPNAKAGSQRAAR